MSAVRPVRVVAADDIAQGVRRLRLRSVDGAPLPAWEPGAHIDLLLPSGLVRQYSLCGVPDELNEYEIAVLREPEGRGGSDEVHHVLQVGTELSIAGPRNRFPLHSAKQYLFIAGGIGITPLLPMIDEVQRRGSDWRLLYGGRSRATMAYLERLAEWTDRVEIRPQDEFGLLDLEQALAARPGGLVYCCGPEPLLRAVESRCEQDRPPGSLVVERFSAGETAPTLGASEAAFEVQLGEQGPVLRVPADQSILKVLQDVDADVLYSCEEGTCGSCETRVICGRPDHRDSLLSEENRDDGLMLVCVSRSLDPRLVLDVEAPPQLADGDVPRRDSA
ncbi:oxidoreductase [Geodermatophilus sp. DF01-2]|nr:oxidoreductase [Geodermatophilus sp. DF01_2]